MPMLPLLGGVQGSQPGDFTPETDPSAVLLVDVFTEPAPPVWREGAQMTIAVEYFIGAELPTTRVQWNDSENNPIDFSTEYVFVVSVGHLGSPPIFTKSAGVTGGPGYVDVQWDANDQLDLNQLSAGRYDFQIRARRIVDSRDRFCQLQLLMKPSLGTGDAGSPGGPP